MPKISNKRRLLRDGKPECYKFRSLPKFLIELVGWKPNDTIEFTLSKSGEIILRNSNRESKSVVSMLFEMQGQKMPGKEEFNAQKKMRYEQQIVKRIKKNGSKG